jgi:hypothetical protein
MRNEAKLISDRMKIEAQKLIKSAEVELGLRKLDKEGKRGEASGGNANKQAGTGARGKSGA